MLSPSKFWFTNHTSLWQMPITVAGGIVRNRGWILKDHIECLLNNNVRYLLYVTDLNEDDTLDILHSYSEVKVIEPTIINNGGSTRDGSDGKPRYCSRAMGELRNIWLHEAVTYFNDGLSKFGQIEIKPIPKYLWMIDSDILVRPDALTRLIAALKIDQTKDPYPYSSKIASCPFVAIGDGVTPIATGGNYEAKNGRYIFHRDKLEKSYGEKVPIKMGGGSYLFDTSELIGRNTESPQVFRTRMARGVLDVYVPTVFGEHPQGEDGHFAEWCHANNCVIMYDPTIRTYHAMDKKYYLENREEILREWV